MHDDIITFNRQLVPNKVKEEYLKRWRALDLPTFEEFHKAVEEWGEKWYVDAEDVRRGYDDYMKGVVGNRLPSGLKYYPMEEAIKVTREANTMILW